MQCAAFPRACVAPRLPAGDSVAGWDGGAVSVRGERRPSGAVAGGTMWGAMAASGGVMDWSDGGAVIRRSGAEEARCAAATKLGSRRRGRRVCCTEGVGGREAVEAASTGSAAAAEEGGGGAAARRGGVRIFAHAPVTAGGSIGASGTASCGGGCSSAGGGAEVVAVGVSEAMLGCDGGCSVVVGGAEAEAVGGGAPSSTASSKRGRSCCIGGGTPASGGAGAGAAGGGAAGAGDSAAEEVVVEDLGLVRGVVAAYVRHPAKAITYARRRAMWLAVNRASSKRRFLSCAVVKRPELAAEPVAGRPVSGVDILMRLAS